LHLTDMRYTGRCKEERMQVPAADIDGATDHGYLLGHSTREQRRLAEQGVILQPITERLLRYAGLRRGMRVLDVGCGIGDVACLVAQIVGSDGAVVGVDFAGTVLSTARSRAASRGLRWARFVEADIAQVSLSDLSIQRFDAVVGRLVLMYQADPTTVLRRLATMVRPGGVLAFLEGIGLPALAWPHRPLYAKCIERLLTTFDRSGAKTDMGLRLHQTFIEAGLPEPEVRLDGMVVAGSDARGFRWLAEVVRSAMPAMERLGIATAAEIEVDTLADRLVEEAESAPGSVCGLALGGAWVRTPAPWVHRATPADTTVLKGSWPPRWPLNSTSSERQGKI
jgi:2-polyprenyl-3-methyl-5-hydroxy-6-metoxy-1,4-benzoquinol methylase